MTEAGWAWKGNEGDIVNGLRISDILTASRSDSGISALLDRSDELVMRAFMVDDIYFEWVVETHASTEEKKRGSATDAWSGLWEKDARAGKKAA